MDEHVQVPDKKPDAPPANLSKQYRTEDPLAPGQQPPMSKQYRTEDPTSPGQQPPMNKVERAEPHPEDLTSK